MLFCALARVFASPLAVKLASLVSGLNRLVANCVGIASNLASGEDARLESTSLFLINI